jgi:hypothetical protein
MTLSEAQIRRKPLSDLEPNRYFFARIHILEPSGDGARRHASHASGTAEIGPITARSEKSEFHSLYVRQSLAILAT